MVTLSFSASAQAGELSPELLVASFKSASGSQLRELSREFEITDDWQGDVCQDLNVSVRQDSGPFVALVQVKSADCQKTFILPLWRVGNAWKFRGAVELSNMYGSEPSVTVKQLVPDNLPAVVVVDNPVASGTGLSQKNMQIFMFIDDRTRAVLDEPEHIFLRTQLSNRRDRVYTQSRDSDFRFIDSKVTSRRSTVIEEVRKSSVNGQNLVEHYAYGWDPRLKALTIQASSPEQPGVQ
jgi:hypothetical protein